MNQPTSASPRTPRRRALAQKNNGIGQQRYALYRSAFSRIKEATAAGFHLEAIAIVESLLSDRLESRLGFLLQQDFSFKTLEKLIERSAKVEPDDHLKQLVQQQVKSWKDQRNWALHEMAKLAEDDPDCWSDRAGALAAVATDGLKILRAVDRRCRQLRALSKC